MLKARRKNRVIRIPDEKADEYKKLGYTIMDMTGNVIYTPKSKDAQITALKEENEQLRKELYAALEESKNAKSGKKAAGTGE